MVVDHAVGRNFEMRFDIVSKEVFCVCKLFESMGILCSHCLDVLLEEKITSVQEKYILDRWGKDFRRANMSILDYAQTGSAEGETRFVYFIFVVYLPVCHSFSMFYSNLYV